MKEKISRSDGTFLHTTEKTDEKCLFLECDTETNKINEILKLSKN